MGSEHAKAAPPGWQPPSGELRLSLGGSDDVNQLEIGRGTLKFRIRHAGAAGD